MGIKLMLVKLMDFFGYRISKSPKREYNIELYLKLYSKNSIENRLFLNIGAGSFFHPAWTNVDYYSDWYKSNDEKTKSGINYDLFSLKPIPVEGNTIEMMYSSHTVEHITDAAAQNLFNESYRILKRGGVVRITAPDINLHYNAYRRNDKDFFYWKDWYVRPEDYKRVMLNTALTETSIEQLFLQRFASATTTIHADGVETRISDDELRKLFNEKSFEDALNSCTSLCTIEKQKQYPGNHMNWWNHEKAEKMLKIAGFKRIVRSGYGQSEFAVLRNIHFFDNTHPKVSFYIEAIKI